MKFASLLVSSLSLIGFGFSWAADAPFIDGKAVKERWATVTPQDMENLRSKKVLITSKSIGLNLLTGLGLLGKENADFKLVDGFQRFDIEKKGGLPIVPADVFKTTNFVHFMGTRYPLIRRVEELDEAMRQPPLKFGPQLDVVMAIYANVDPKIFPDYKRLMDGLTRDYPNVRVIHATTSIYAPGKQADSSHPKMEAFNQLLRNEYRGKAPVFDLSAVLSDDFRDGKVMCAEYTKDPTGVHPNVPLGMTTLAKGFVLAMRDTLNWKAPDAKTGATVQTPVPPTKAVAPLISSEHPEYRAVRAILDRNGLTKMKVEGQIEVKDGHIVGLAIQESGVTVIPDEIGVLVKLKRLHCYGDRELKFPYLKSISPAIAKCKELHELLLNHNALTTLPAEIASLTQITSLSIADNHLSNLAPEAEAWAKKHDPAGFAQQTQP